MKVICKKTNSKDFDLSFVTTVMRNDIDYTFGGYGFEINNEYIVMGLLIFRKSACVYYLIDTHGRPFSFPSLLFDIADNKLPKNWFVNTTDGGFSLMCGFEEFCNDEKYYLQLLERDDKAMTIYFERKKEYELEYGSTNEGNNKTSSEENIF